MALQGQQSEKKKHKTYTDLQTSSSYSQQPIIESPNQTHLPLLTNQIDSQSSSLYNTSLQSTSSYQTAAAHPSISAYQPTNKLTALYQSPIVPDFQVIFFI